jgi:4'-phosphopantetheinyl transferase
VKAPPRWRLARGSELPPEREDAGWLSPAELARARAMQPGRRADFRLGRFVARLVLGAHLGLDRAALARLEVRAAPDGAPEVHEGDLRLPIAISISHRDRRALCVLSDDEGPLGCDLERIEARSEAFLAEFLTSAERARVAAAGRHAWLAAALAWSGKESCLKALRTGLRRDALGVEVEWDELDGELAGWRTLRAVDRERGGRLAGCWRTREGFVLTVLRTLREHDS